MPLGSPAPRPGAVAVGAAALALLLAACTPAARTSSAAAGSSASRPASSGVSTAPTPPSTVAPRITPSTPGPAPGSGRPVHIKLLESDGGVYGVGMPIVAYFSANIGQARDFVKATTVTVNGAPTGGAWYFRTSSQLPGYPLEAHYRPPRYWPGHARITMNMATHGVTAGPGLVFDNSLTLTASTGPADITTVDCRAERMTVTSDGKTQRVMPTSCGKATTPTFTGTKIVMQKGEDLPRSQTLRPNGAVRMVSNNPADPYDLIVPWSVRLTNSGEYAHAASWNGGNIGLRSTSNGCTNLNVTDAQWFYRFSRIGDVLTYRNTAGILMPSWDGFGDWNISWAAWLSGGLLATG
jgi:lipoprotein-anchoring transpeptidase ErfK/SrfK